MTRRTVLNWLIGGAGVVVASVIAIPSLLAALAPAVRPPRARRWQPLGPLGSFPIGDAMKAVIAADATTPSSPHGLPAQAVYVWRASATETVVFSRACTDVGCPVNYDPGSKFYYCPCHGGIFNTSGQPVAGPPARALYRYATRVRAGVLEIDLGSVPVVA